MAFSLPPDFIERMKDMLSFEYDAFVQSYESANYQALRVNRLKGGVQRFLSTAEFSDDLSPVTWTEDGFYYPETLRPGKHPYHEAGVYYIQEPSAMLPATLLDPKPGERVLDLCAAPGGKSTQIASAMQQQGLLISNEIHPSRAKILSENIERMGIRNVIVTNESPNSLSPRFPSYFDRIMVDAPCSGEGMFRKNEEAIKQWSLENVQICADRQDEILDQADLMLRPGGTIVYSTCTFAPAENEGSISRFLERHPNYQLVQQQRLWPHKIQGEGHFVAVLKKSEPADYVMPTCSVLAGKNDFYLENNHVQYATSGRKKGKKSNTGDPVLLPLEDFLKDNLHFAFNGKLELYGDQIYLTDSDAPSLLGLRVLRPGLHLGTILKHRFEPSHALALTLKPEDVLNCINLSSDKPDELRLISEYVNGQTFPCDGEKGWYLICLDGYSIGWGKLAGGIMKNHYPKGLRKSL